MTNTIEAFRSSVIDYLNLGEYPIDVEFRKSGIQKRIILTNMHLLRFKHYGFLNTSINITANIDQRFDRLLKQYDLVNIFIKENLNSSDNITYILPSCNVLINARIALEFSIGNTDSVTFYSTELFQTKDEYNMSKALM